MRKLHLYTLLLITIILISCNSTPKTSHDVVVFKEKLHKITDSLRTTLPYSSFMGTVTDVGFSKDTINLTIYPNILLNGLFGGSNKPIFEKLLKAEVLKSLSKKIKLQKSTLQKSNVTIQVQYINLKSSQSSITFYLSNKDLLSSLNEIDNKTLLDMNDYSKLILSIQNELPKSINENVILNHIGIKDNNIILDCQLYNVGIKNFDMSMRKEAKNKALEITKSWASQMQSIFNDFVTYDINFNYIIHDNNGSELTQIMIPAEEIINQLNETE